MNKSVVALCAILFVLFTSILLCSPESEQRIVTLNPIRVNSAPIIDGKLDDEIWQNAAQVDDVFITYNPVDGQILPQKTKVWLAFDEDNLYFAFYCYDDEPDKIKTSVTKRDNLWNDDWIGLALDPMANNQSLYELFVNPSGMQGDLYCTPASGENSAPDWVWYSGGQIVRDGYTVEIQLPLKSIRFQHGENVKMNILFWRRISRQGMSGSWPRLDPEKGMLNSTTGVVYPKLDSQLLLEFIPSVTYSSIWDRENPEKWKDPDDSSDFGVSAKYGITSSITAELALNPDFSQVESDSFQVLQNTRYPIFYSEKRPFFMEAGDMFNIAGTSNNLSRAVHTRKIVDPAWGARLTGDIGNFTFGLLGAGDEWAGRKSDDNFYPGKNDYYMIGRAKYSMEGGHYIGLLYSGRELADYHNRVIAADAAFRFGGGHFISANYIYTDTNDPEFEDKYSGRAVSGKYQYSTETLYGRLAFENYDENFRMDTAFYQRVGIFSSEVVLVPIFSIKSENLDWLKSIQPVIYGKYLHDYVTDMNDVYFNIGIQLYFIKQGYFTLAWDIIDDESWEGTTYDTSSWWGNAGVQLMNWLYLSCYFELGNRIYYSTEAPFLGECFSSSLYARLEPIDTLSFGFSYDYVDFNNKSTGEDVYDYHILYSRVTYQPSKHLFFRGIVQYDSYLDLILSDILLSYEFVPGTVFHLGYGSLHTKLFWNQASQEWLSNADKMQFYNISQSIFLKASYRIQF